MSNEILIHQIQRALSAAANQVDVVGPPLTTELSEPRTAGRSRSRTTRWLLPAVAAALVAGLLAARVLIWHQHDTAATATQVVVDGNVADVGGVRFPVPDGWHTQVIGSDSAAVHVCVAQQSAAAGCDGVQLDIAVPGWFGRIVILPQPPFFHQCGNDSGTYILTDDHNPIDVAGRAGVHEWAYCGDDPTAVSHLWQLVDGSLQIYSPPGRYAAQIASMVAGLDLSAWAHHQGPQIQFFTSGSSAPPTG